MPSAKLSANINTKLGPLIHGWSISAGKAWSCPGETKLCGSRCYAKHGFFRMPSVDRSHKNNFEFSHAPEFASWMIATLHAGMVRVLRVHVAGDFYNEAYVEKWLQVVQQSPNCHFFAYTRSWRRDELFPGLVRLSQLPNFSMWWSIDRETGPAPIVRGVRRAYMAIDDVDAGLAPDDCDLVFRDGTKTIMKRANGVQVCPYENGVKTQVNMTCSRCGICWHDKLPQWQQAMEPYITSTELLAPVVAGAGDHIETTPARQISV